MWRLKQFISKRIQLNRSLHSKSLIFRKFGEPIDVLEMTEQELPQPAGDQVLLKVLLSPINPADINYVQGRYAEKPKEFPARVGNEFVAEVVAVGGDIKDFQPGNIVVPLEMGLGGWSTHLLLKRSHVTRVPESTDLVQAATLSINPCTAYRMLKDFVQLCPDDCVIQNGANSGVGQAVHQLCKLWGIQSVGIIRDRPDVERLKDYLRELGATEVLTDKELKETKIFKDCLPKPKLALNCVGGKVAELTAKQMANYGIMVTYGGMSLKPFGLPAGALIFRQQKYVGFWLTEWRKAHIGTEGQREMYEEIVKYMTDGKFLGPQCELMPFEDFKRNPEALALTGFANKKFLFDMRSDQDMNCSTN